MALSRKRKIGCAFALLFLLGVSAIAAEPLLYVFVYGDPEDIVNDFQRAEVPEGDRVRFLTLVGPRVKGELKRRVMNPSEPLRMYMVDALGEMGDVKSVPTLQAILEDPRESDHVRAEAKRNIELIARGGTRDEVGEKRSLVEDIVLIYEIAD